MKVKVFLNLFKYFGIKFFGVLSSSIIIFYLQKKYGNEIQGFYGVLSNSILLLTILSHFGIPSLVSLQMAYYNKHNVNRVKQIINNCLKTILIIQPVFIPLLIYQFYNITYSFTDVALLCIAIFSNVLIYFYAYVLRGLSEYGWMIFFTETSRWVIVLLTLLLFQDIIEIKKLIVFSILLSSLLTFTLAYFKTKYLGYNFSYLFYKINLNGIKKTLFSSLSLMVASFGMLCIQQINIIQLSYYQPIAEVGFFNFTFKYLMITIMPVSVISAKYAHLTSEYYFNKKYSEVRKNLAFSSIASLCITAIAITFLYAISSYIYPFVNQKFDYKLFLLIGGSMLLFSLYGFWVSFLTQIKKSNSIVFTLFLAIICNLIVNYIVTPKYSYYGTAISDLVSNLIMLISCVYIIFNFLKKDEK
ncbi:lipopolysaccharide biosynthesis protein [Algibacter pectinivorans]|uniref:Membrane protein involved in the export of O-antigen and teichoic acid n=1 Tax=Algibacter pectinivorans TaxID=870482 RepID=A0A1I1NMQ0_9FLAO|nr:oligosaccharide flippase family protein [Algibacter pectinivorans]SFC96033.1 Membrane protein involved in the export of O-antigen and teichoic acid [Algibacter pectinivorans]